MFFVPARFIFWGRLSFFIICYWKSWKEQNQQALLSTQINLQSCVTGVTQFLKIKLNQICVLINIGRFSH